SLLALPSTREKRSKKVGEEILELLTKPTAKERSLAEKFKSHGGAQVMEFCPHGTKVECLKAQQAKEEMLTARNCLVSRPGLFSPASIRFELKSSTIFLATPKAPFIVVKMTPVGPVPSQPAAYKPLSMTSFSPLT
uniref:Uncharacterized protein n=1 Tax=Megaselia scalaris TaxID=36166 RepID=T1GC92_MEGSC